MHAQALLLRRPCIPLLLLAPFANVCSIFPSTPSLLPFLAVQHLKRTACAMDKKLQKMEKKLAAASGMQVSAMNRRLSCSCAHPQPPPLQVAGVAKKTPAEKQLQRDAKAIVKKSMVHAAAA